MLNHIINLNRRARDPYASTNVPWCSFDVKLTLFALFNVLLSSMDLGSDSWQSKVYRENGDINWSNVTIIIVFVLFLPCSNDNPGARSSIHVLLDAF